MGHGDPQKIAIFGPLGSYPAPPPWYRFWQLAAYAAACRAAHEEILSLAYSMIGDPANDLYMPVASYDAAKISGRRHHIDLYSTINSGYFVTIDPIELP